MVKKSVACVEVRTEFIVLSNMGGRGGTVVEAGIIISGRVGKYMCRKIDCENVMVRRYWQLRAVVAEAS